MAATFRLTSALLVIAVILVASGCDQPNAGNNPQRVNFGTLTGIVVDDVEMLSEDEEQQSYAGATVKISLAIEAGTYRISAEQPLQVSYEKGETVSEFQTDSKGAFEFELAPGTYFVHALYGDKSHSEDLIVEIHEGETTETTLELIHGV